MYYNNKKIKGGNMPLISTKDNRLHLEFKKSLIGTDYTLGSAVDKLINLNFELKLLELTDKQIIVLKDMIENLINGWDE